MRRRTSSARLLAFAIVVLTTPALAAPHVRLHVAEDSSCEGTHGLATRLARKGIVVSESEADGVDISVRAMSNPGSADAELVIRRGALSAVRTLSAPTCDEVLDALVFTVTLALEQPFEQAPPPAQPTEPPPVTDPAPPPPLVAPRIEHGLGWGGGAGAGMFAGASPSAAVAVAVHADLESRARGLVAPSASVGAAFVLPSSTRSAGSDVAFALQMATLDACPLHLRLWRGSLAVRPCLDLQLGRLQSRGAGFVGARLEASPWVALALALRGRVAIGAGISFELDIAAGSPLIQGVFSLGDRRVYGAGPVVFSSIAGLGVHFP